MAAGALAGIGAAGSVIGGIGGAIGAFGKKKPERQVYSRSADSGLEALGQAITGDNPAIESSLADFGTATKSRIGNTKRLAGMAETDYGDLLAGAKLYDPVLTSERLLSSQTGALKDMMGNAGDLGRRQESLALASLGRGGAPSRGSYERALIADRTARVFAPQFGNIISNMPGMYGTAENARLANLGLASEMVGARTGTADYGAGLELLPAQARIDMRRGQAGAYGDVVSGQAANTSGFTQHSDTLAKVGDSLEAFGGGLANAGSLGMGGGLGGGGGQQQQQWWYPQQQYQNPSMLYGMPGQGWGGGTQQSWLGNMMYGSPQFQYTPVGPYGQNYWDMNPAQRAMVDYQQTYGG